MCTWCSFRLEACQDDKIKEANRCVEKEQYYGKEIMVFQMNCKYYFCNDYIYI